ncbi:hypothetical protein PV10_06367 [Exophiala mesophila]|uniref:Uncharacterized protein n=1 Tax=Exophiala mesophila TaxID=212818 RepID=A0A0D1XUJ4_EXOME|nr:uncharacterized protein PV10_06367 [Exophiala mesophila]KIV91876.1 hypothetical protein PV10_06367 [Exophiala mesophila]
MPSLFKKIKQHASSKSKHSGSIREDPKPSSSKQSNSYSGQSTSRDFGYSDRGRDPAPKDSPSNTDTRAENNVEASGKKGKGKSKADDRNRSDDQIYENPSANCSGEDDISRDVGQHERRASSPTEEEIRQYKRDRRAATYSTENWRRYYPEWFPQEGDSPEEIANKEMFRAEKFTTDPEAIRDRRDTTVGNAYAMFQRSVNGVQTRDFAEDSR